MEFTDGDCLSSVLERDVDLMFVQLVRTSPTFREWFFEQVAPDQTVGRFLGVKKSVYGGEGESDVAFGIERADECRTLVLIEDKIDEPPQDRQAARYYERGRQHVENADWDDFRVCLIAPEGYLTGASGEDYGTVVSFEEIVECVRGLDHDAEPAVLEVFERAIEKHEDGTSGGSSGDSTVTAAVAGRISRMQARLPAVAPEEPSAKNLRIPADHPNHPDGARYHVYVSGPYDDGKAIVRIDLDKRCSGSEIERIREVLSDSIDDLDEFEYDPEAYMGAVRTEVWREYSDRDEFVGRIATAVDDLVSFYHRRLVNGTTSD